MCHRQSRQERVCWTETWCCKIYSSFFLPQGKSFFLSLFFFQNLLPGCLKEQHSSKTQYLPLSHFLPLFLLLLFPLYRSKFMLSSRLWARKRTLRSLVLIWFHLALLTAFQIPNIIPPVLLWLGLAGLMMWQLVSHSPFCDFREESHGALFPNISTLSLCLRAKFWTLDDTVMRTENIQDLIEPICKYACWELAALFRRIVTSSIFLCVTATLSLFHV